MTHDLYTLLEPVIVALIVILSALAALRRHLPAAWKWLTGNAVRSAACHEASDGCGSSCGGCGSTSTRGSERAIHLHKARHQRDQAY